MTVAKADAAPEPGGQGFVDALQADGRLLLRYVARRPDVTVAAPDAGQGPDYSVLNMGLGSGEEARRRLTALAVLVDSLSRAAAPATIATIRLSSAYLRFSLEDGAPNPSVAAAEDTARRIRARIRWLMGIGILATAAALLLLAHANDGRRAIQQLQSSRAEIASLDAQLARLTGAWQEGAPAAEPPEGAGSAARQAYIPYCPVGDDVGRVPNATEAGAQAKGLCGQRDQAVLRQDLVFARLAEFNCRLRGVATLWRDCPDPGAAPPKEASMAIHWQRTEIRTTATISVLSGFVLPLLMGCVGGCAYALRRLDHKLSRWMLEAYDGTHALLRVLLASMLGGLLGVLWTGDEMVQLSGYTLSLAALAFFVGFSVEVVFSTIEALVDGVSARMRAQPQPNGGRV